MASSKTTSRTPRAGARFGTSHPSTQMLVAGVIAEAVAIVAGILGWVLTTGSPSGAMTVLLVGTVVSVVASALAGILALVGLFRYSRHTVAFALLLLASILFNPITGFMLIAMFA